LEAQSGGDLLLVKNLCQTLLEKSKTTGGGRKKRGEEKSVLKKL